MVCERVSAAVDDKVTRDLGGLTLAAAAAWELI